MEEKRAARRLPLPYFSKDETNIVKGVAIIFMFIYHFFTFPSWIITGSDYPNLSSFANLFQMPLRICIPIFAFLTGYLYFHAKEKTFKYSARKILNIYISYWVVLAILAIIIFICNIPFNPGIKATLYEIVGVRNGIMCFCWYVFFYAISMLLLALIRPLLKTLSGTIIMVIISSICFKAISLYPIGIIGKYYASALGGFFPCILMGAACAQGKFFEKYLDPMLAKRFKRKGVSLIALALTSLAVFIVRKKVPSLCLFQLVTPSGNTDLTINLDLIYAPIICYTIINIFRIIRFKPLTTVLTEFGSMSLLMWFIHCVFFNASKSYTQPLLYWLYNPIAVTAWGLLLCYCAAKIFIIPINFLQNLAAKTRLFRPKTAKRRSR